MTETLIRRVARLPARASRPPVGAAFAFALVLATAAACG